MQLFIVAVNVNIVWTSFFTNAEIGVFSYSSHLSGVRLRNPIYKHGQFLCDMIYTPQLNTRISDGIRPSAKYAMTNKRMRAKR